MNKRYWQLQEISICFMRELFLTKEEKQNLFEQQCIEIEEMFKNKAEVILSICGISVGDLKTSYIV